ncbi:hypothetical protein F5Y16DRAFT_258928 [Xylariaceae sp. FL0255]|nr:hypothetical protein F5Y16DRAFT_258928 [Xylariaceae sp. FL0255]
MMMKAVRSSFICPQCRLVRPRTNIPSRLSLFRNNTAARLYSSESTTTTPYQSQRNPNAPTRNINIKHIRQNPELYEQNCLERNYKVQATYPARVNELFEQLKARQKEGRSLRERSNELRREIVNPATIQHEGDNTTNTNSTTTTQAMTDKPQLRDVKTMTKEELLEEARQLKQSLSTLVEDESRIEAEMEDLAAAIPNLTSDETPRGDEALVLSYINEPHPLLVEPKGPASSSSSSSDRIWRSHVHIGTELGILDFASAGKTSGWGWYFLLDEAAQLEQALISFALASVTRVAGWRQGSPPSVVYSHMADACGFQPRDQNGETQTYALSQGVKKDDKKPERSLAATAEIPFAGMRTGTSFDVSELPLKVVGASRCFRAEAGARGKRTQGLYRVHEFTKVEMFAWTRPDEDSTTDIFDEMVDIQTDILSSLGLHCRVLEMPSADLGASAVRKIDIETFFPSRVGLGVEGEAESGWGEVTSASICRDYQTRRLDTRITAGKGVKKEDLGGGYPWTVNGTALAVPRVLAAILENGWDEETMSVVIPECLRPWMDGAERIGMRRRVKAGVGLGRD